MSNVPRKAHAMTYVDSISIYKFVEIMRQILESKDYAKMWKLIDCHIVNGMVMPCRECAVFTQTILAGNPQSRLRGHKCANKKGHSLYHVRDCDTFLGAQCSGECMSIPQDGEVPSPHLTEIHQCRNCGLLALELTFEMSFGQMGWWMYDLTRYDIVTRKSKFRKNCPP